MSDDAPPSPSVNDEIYSCLDLDNPKSFFLFAGAGSGKTRSLVEVLEKFQEKNVHTLRKRGQKVAIITYTNAARDEIKRRLEFDSSFHVSTIHSFAWDLINPYRQDIKAWIGATLEAGIADLLEKQAKAKGTATKTYLDRASKVESKQRRLAALPEIKKFIYSPNGDNAGRDALQHTEVIQIAAFFVLNKPLMRNILVRKYPILLIDESQDTNKELIDAFFSVQDEMQSCFSLGMFGDVMQRIYFDGKSDLGENIPDSWARPVKTINYRCPRRVIQLINKVRLDADGQQQESGKDEEGVIRLFIVDSGQTVDKEAVERSIVAAMAECTGDTDWSLAASAVKVLTLEHHMAASRGGFSVFFEPLYKVDKCKTGLLDGTLSGVPLFSKQILPLVKAKTSGDEFAVAKIVREHSPLLRKDILKANEEQIKNVRLARDAVANVCSLWDDDKNPSLADVLGKIYETRLFVIPEVLVPIARRFGLGENPPDDEAEERSDSVLEAWDKAVQCLFSQFEEYVKYVSDESKFGTHQGIKGLEFPRVMVILDDADARGRWFGYEKLFGAKEPSETDLNNEAEGKETGIDRTRRLFYVTCSRAEKSLAVVAYTKEPALVKDHVLSQEWFSEDEVVELD
jgi:DNA helicase-2/ATP-dependent DNA helicase PcrA